MRRLLLVFLVLARRRRCPARAGAAARGRRRTRECARSRPRRTSSRGPSRSSRARTRAGRSCSSTRSSRRLEAVQRQSGLPTRGRDILVQAYELRARAYFNIGLQEKASADFRQLVQIKPDYTLGKDKVSPKVIEVFNLVKKSLVGYLAVSSTAAREPRSRSIAGGDRKTELGLTDFFPLEVLAGDYTVEVAKEGYKSETRTGQHRPPATEALEVALIRTLASTFFITEPAGVEVWVDGELRLTTGGHPRSRLLRAGPRQGPRALAGLGPHRDRRTSRSARTSWSCADAATRPVRRELETTVRPGLRDRSHQDGGLAGLAAPHLRAPGRQDLHEWRGARA